MTKFFYILIVLSIFLNCNQVLSHDLKILLEKNRSLNIQNQYLKNKNEKLTLENTNIEEQFKEKKIILGGKEPLYILKLELSQSRVSLDIGDHIKDSMNKCKFELPVSRSFYEKVKKDDNILDNFRMGSFIINGSISSWEIIVIDKKIIEGN